MWFVKLVCWFWDVVAMEVRLFFLWYSVPKVYFV